MLNHLNTIGAYQLCNLILQEVIAYLLNIYTYAFTIALYTTIINKVYLWIVRIRTARYHGLPKHSVWSSTTNLATTHLFVVVTGLEPVPSVSKTEMLNHYTIPQYSKP